MAITPWRLAGPQRTSGDGKLERLFVAREHTVVRYLHAVAHSNRPTRLDARPAGAWLTLSIGVSPDQPREEPNDEHAGNLLVQEPLTNGSLRWDPPYLALNPGDSLWIEGPSLSAEIRENVDELRRIGEVNLAYALERDGQPPWPVVSIFGTEHATESGND